MKNDGACLDSRLCKPKQRESIGFRVCVYLLMVGVCGWWMVDVHRETQIMLEYIETRAKEYPAFQQDFMKECSKMRPGVHLAGMAKYTGAYNVAVGCKALQCIPQMFLGAKANEKR